uniref:Uncharacterized protein n=1 Tax=Avena sativa TaxID=4498 RepID=A0ACD5YPT8_AVESA
MTERKKGNSLSSLPKPPGNCRKRAPEPPLPNQRPSRSSSLISRNLMAMAATSRPSGPVLSIPNYGCASPNRVKLAAAVVARSPGKSVSVASPPYARSRPSCMCSPTNHPGSFRCSKHKERKQEATACHGNGHSKPASAPSPSSLGSGGASKLGTRRSGSALVRVGGAGESGTWARRALSPSPQSPHRRRAAGVFRPRPSRLSAVSFAGDRAGENRRKRIGDIFRE